MENRAGLQTFCIATLLWSSRRDGKSLKVMAPVPTEPGFMFDADSQKGLERDLKGKEEAKDMSNPRRTDWITDMQRVFSIYATQGQSLWNTNLRRFLHRVQAQHDVDLTMALNLIEQYETKENARRMWYMTFEGFLNYLESIECIAFDPTHAAVYQDMDHPLSHYFIFSSHNTYLTRDQLVGESHLDAYQRALEKGCRCLEIDCWDGSNLEPVVYHGYTLTSKLLFKDVITTIERYAFVASPYPVIISLENHCCKDQQDVMAQHLVSILGDKLLRQPLDNVPPGQLPSPEMLKYKILIKNKKLKPQREGEEAAGTSSKDEDEDEVEEEDDVEDEVFKDEDDEKDKQMFEVRKREMEAQRYKQEHSSKRVHWPWKRRKVEKKVQKVKVAVSQRLSDLVVYTASVKFHNFRHSKENQSCFENTSMGESKARKLVQNSGEDFVKHNQTFLSRIYPKGSRMDSSNFDPQQFWNVGAQLVALNLQTNGRPVHLNEGRFRDNGRCGYILKPDILLSSEAFNPSPATEQSPRSILLNLEVIRGTRFPVPRLTGLLVRVEIYGVKGNDSVASTKVVKNNMENPYWGTKMKFPIMEPDLCLVRFCLRNQIAFTTEFVGQYTLPLRSLRRGYRWVPLQDRDGSRLESAALHIHVQK